MMRRFPVAAAVLAMTVAAVPVRAGLMVGDPAPAFTIDMWLEGGPEDLATGKGKKIYVLDFWATWCLPCIYQIPELTAMQRRLGGRGVQVIGVTGPAQGQTVEQVRQFLKTRPKGVGYTIGWDSSLRMWDNYLTAAGAEGIPYVVIVDKKGRIAWHGHQSPQISQVVEELAAGTFDMERAVTRARNESKIVQKFSAINMAVMMKNWPQVVGLLDEVLELDPTHAEALLYGYQIRVNEMGESANVRGWVETFLSKHGDDGAALTAMSNVLMMIADPAQRLPALVLRTARAAYKAGGGRDIAAIEAYARAANLVGHLDEAIRLQNEAIRAAPEHSRPVLAKRLVYYETCRKLRDTEF